MSADKYAESVVTEFVRNITDHVFLAIENDEQLKQKYDSAVEVFGKESVNQEIGKTVKVRLNLENDGKNDSPKSRLIKSYTYHKLNQEDK
ncbi:hypothetical protein AGMMS49938_05190 [Fibrobacterales bacterium]|nr:hypothetical protein AGMMS49938_05190 [Fibrobacterales bacterium]